MDENRTERPYIGRLPAVTVALILACVAASISYRAYLAKGASEAAQSACADRNTFSEAYRNCLARFSQDEQR
jgi:Tfp pilus assembly protein PilE